MTTASELRSALESALSQLILLGGDPRGDENGDRIQAAVLAEIDAAAKTHLPALLARNEALEAIASSAREVLDELNARIEAAVWDGRTFPPFASIAGLHSAIAKVDGLSAAEPSGARGEMAANRYRKKPVVIEAVQWFPGVEHPGVHFDMGSATIGGRGIHPPQTFKQKDRPYVITIHEQKAFLEPGDWILPEPKEGRFYPCKPDIFEATYEPVAALASNEEPSR